MSTSTENKNNNLDLSDDQLKLIEKAANENGIKEFETVSNIGSAKGDNFTAQVLKVQVTDKNSDKKISLILKITKVDGMFPASDFFVREALMYKDILPYLLKFQSDANISNPFKGVAKYYGHYLKDNQEAVLMEDLTSKRFTMWNKRYPMEDDHISLVMEEYAKLHAISFAIMKKDPRKYEELKGQLTDILWGKFTESNVKMIQSAKANGMKALRDDTLRKRFDESWDGCLQSMKEANEEKLVVVTHEDAWCNNMMFNYKDTAVQEVCLLDWQLSKMGTPIWDLVYFFHVCGSKQVLSNYKKYLQLYHKILSENLEEFGCDADEIFSYETLFEKWNKYASIGLFLVLITGKVMVSDSDDIPDDGDLREQMSEDLNKSFIDAIVIDDTKQAIHDQRITDVVQYMADNDFLKKISFSDQHPPQ